MKKYLIILSILFLSCSKEDSCEQQLKEAYSNYEKALQNCGGSYSAMQVVQSQYEVKQKSILNNCK